MGVAGRIQVPAGRVHADHVANLVGVVRLEWVCLLMALVGYLELGEQSEPPINRIELHTICVQWFSDCHNVDFEWVYHACVKIFVTTNLKTTVQ